MYALKKGDEILYILEEKPTDIQISDMGCDSCVEYNPEEKPPTAQEIGEKITQEVYDGNPFAQIADLAKAQITTLALLTPIVGKETINIAYADMIESVRRVSDERVKNGLSSYDLSFLE